MNFEDVLRIASDLHRSESNNGAGESDGGSSLSLRQLVPVHESLLQMLGPTEASASNENKASKSSTLLDEFLTPLKEEAAEGGLPLPSPPSSLAPCLRHLLLGEIGRAHV